MKGVIINHPHQAAFEVNRLYTERVVWSGTVFPPYGLSFTSRLPVTKGRGGGHRNLQHQSDLEERQAHY